MQKKFFLFRSLTRDAFDLGVRCPFKAATNKYVSFFESPLAPKSSLKVPYYNSLPIFSTNNIASLACQLASRKLEKSILLLLALLSRRCVLKRGTLEIILL